MGELEDWERDELKSPDCDGAYWMILRGRKELLEKNYNLSDREYRLIEYPDEN